MEIVFNMSPPPPPAPPRPSNTINDLIREKSLDEYMVVGTSGLLVVLLLWHVAQAFVKRLWLLPSHSSRILALNAATLALLSIVAKPSKPGNLDEADSGTGNENRMLTNTVLICTVVGAFMPSVAASTDIKDMWSNVIGVGLLIVSVDFINFLLLLYTPYGESLPTIYQTAMEHKIVMVSLFVLLLVLLVQAVALEAMMSDMKAMVSEQLEQLCLETRPGYKADWIVENRAWSWEVMEHNARIKLMMVLTSNPQNVMARSPSAALIGALVLLCGTIVLIRRPEAFVSAHCQGQAFVVCGFICVWRWGRVALQEDRCLSSLVFNAEPSYWRRKVNNFRRTLKAGTLKAGLRSAVQPNVLEEGQYGFQEVLCYTAAFLMLCFVVPLHRFMVAIIRFTHIFSALLMRKLIFLPIKALACSIFVLIRKILLIKSCQVVDAAAAAESSRSHESLGVVCLEGEDACIVGREFAGAANRIIRRQQKRARNNKSDLKALIFHLQRSTSGSANIVAEKSNGVLNYVLNQDGVPPVENLHVEHGYQFGWSLTVISLLELMVKIEVTALGKSTMSEAAMNAIWQAMEMMQLVDKQFEPCIVCSKEVYASACASAWSKLQTKKRRWTKNGHQVSPEVKLEVIDQILKDTLGATKSHIEEFNKTQNSMISDSNIAIEWSEQIVMFYTIHTVYQNLSRCWMDMQAVAIVAIGRKEEENNASKMIEGMVEHINVLIGEILACCLSNLPIALDRSMTAAVLSDNLSDIERGLIVIAQGTHIWEELQWPTIYSPSLGHLRQWM